MAVAKQESQKLSTLYGDLQRFEEAGDYTKAIRAAETILREEPAEIEALHCLIVCLLQQNEFQKALDKILKLKDWSGLVFEKAYAEYRLYKNKEALATLKSPSKLDLRCKELLAQLLYRLEDFEGSYDLYKDVAKNSQDDYEDERQTNVSAVAAALSLSSSSVDLESPDPADDNYDRCYNAACFLIGRGDYSGAAQQLTRSETLCRETLDEDDDMTEEEKEDELAIIRVQMAYCAQMLGNTTEAMKIYNALFKKKPSDMSVTAVAANNVVSINEDQNVFDSKKKMKLASAPELSKKLTSTQLRNIDVNNCLLAYYSNQGDVCRNCCQKLKEKHSDHDTAALIESCLLIKARQPAKAIELLQSYMSSTTSPSLAAQLSLASLYLSVGQISKLCEVLRELGPVTYKPAIVSLLVSLYLSQQDESSISEFFAEVISWYERNEDGSRALQDILRAAADFQLKAQNPRLAASLLEKLKKLTPGDRGILSMLFAAYSQFDADKAKQVSNELPSVESLAEAIDIEALESSTALFSHKSKTRKEDKPSGDGLELLEKKKKRKKRKGKLPKEYNPAVDPDPERWLPRRERSTWKGRRRDKRKEHVGKGSQGTALSGGPELDITKMETSEAAPQPVPASSSKGYSASKQQQKKKKTKKGKK
ncbi:signal recognition particle subunit SRP72-like [Watersipora subatra]|uniref:signal recognition particle subunit SRP72-like n=1 Tax=Watersipora subatra TaxID=2589382 RepID=UPI00355BFCB0